MRKREERKENSLFLLSLSLSAFLLPISFALLVSPLSLGFALALSILTSPFALLFSLSGCLRAVDEANGRAHRTPAAPR
jgi:hypothetical protein